MIIYAFAGKKALWNLNKPVTIEIQIVGEKSVKQSNIKLNTCEVPLNQSSDYFTLKRT